jgi:hypothetical protein
LHHDAKLSGFASKLVLTNMRHREYRDSHLQSASQSGKEGIKEDDCVSSEPHLSHGFFDSLLSTDSTVQNKRLHYQTLVTAEEHHPVERQCGRRRTIVEFMVK